MSKQQSKHSSLSSYVTQTAFFNLCTPSAVAVASRIVIKPQFSAHIFITISSTEANRPDSVSSLLLFHVQQRYQSRALWDLEMARP